MAPPTRPLSADSRAGLSFRRLPMSTHTISLREPAPVVLARLRREATRYGASVTGDDTAGTITAKAPGGIEAEATYAVDGDSLVLTVTKKPPFVPDEMIAAALASFFGT